MKIALQSTTAVMVPVTRQQKVNLSLFAKMLQYDSNEDLEMVIQSMPFHVVCEPPRDSRLHTYCLRFCYDMTEHFGDVIPKYLGFAGFTQMCDVIHRLQYKNKRMTVISRKVDAHTIMIALRIYSV